MKRRSWFTFGGSMFLVGGFFFVAVIISLSNTDKAELMDALLIHCILAAISLPMAVCGLGVLIWDWRQKHQDSCGKIDKSINYVFTLTVGNESHIVKEFEEIELALMDLQYSRQGVVNVKIEPPMASICNIDCSYQNGYFTTYYLQQRKDGMGYWFSLSPTTGVTMNNLKRLYVKHKKIDFSNYNHKKTGEGR